MNVLWHVFICSSITRRQSDCLLGFPFQSTSVSVAFPYGPVRPIPTVGHAARQATCDKLARHITSTYVCNAALGRLLHPPALRVYVIIHLECEHIMVAGGLHLTRRQSCVTTHNAPLGSSEDSIDHSSLRAAGGTWRIEVAPGSGNLQSSKKADVR